MRETSKRGREDSSSSSSEEMVKERKGQKKKKNTVPKNVFDFQEEERLQIIDIAISSIDGRDRAPPAIERDKNGDGR